jgi:hypothetical protein
MELDERSHQPGKIRPKIAAMQPGEYGSENRLPPRVSAK